MVILLKRNQPSSRPEIPEDKINILAVISFTDFLDVILRTKTINIRNITSVGNGRILHN